MPKKGTVAEPGLVSIAPGNGVTMIEPVSVCLEEDIENVHRYFENSRTRTCNDSALLLSNMFVVPVPGFGVNRRSKDT
jgi:hypothetical protein